MLVPQWQHWILWGDQYTFHKNVGPPINISITTAVRVTRRNYKKGQSFIRASYASLYPSQIRKLKEMAHSEGKAVAEVIREAVKRFLAKPVPEGDALNLNSSSTEAAKRVYPRVPQSDWDMLNRISARTSRTRTDLVREAVGEYLRESA